MLRLYRSLVRSKLDYACIVYGSARKSFWQMLDPLHIQGLRLCLGTLIASPVESLHVDAYEPCLGARRAKLNKFGYLSIFFSLHQYQFFLQD